MGPKRLSDQLPQTFFSAQFLFRQPVSNYGIVVVKVPLKLLCTLDGKGELFAGSKETQRTAPPNLFLANFFFRQPVSNCGIVVVKCCWSCCLCTLDGKGELFAGSKETQRTAPPNFFSAQFFFRQPVSKYGIVVIKMLLKLLFMYSRWKGGAVRWVWRDSAYSSSKLFFGQIFSRQPVSNCGMVMVKVPLKLLFMYTRWKGGAVRWVQRDSANSSPNLFFSPIFFPDNLFRTMALFWLKCWKGVAREIKSNRVPPVQSSELLYTH